jgi:hypothetical protein
MARLKASVKNHLGDRLISDEKEETLIFAAHKHRLLTLPWCLSERSWRLSTPYGSLAILGYVAGTSVVRRQDADLVHSSNGKLAVFRTVKAAKAAAIYHVSDGFHGLTETADGCCWQMPRSICPTSIPVHEFNPDDGEMLPGYEISDSLNDHLKGSGLADANLLADIRAGERTWSLRRPKWTTLSVRQHVLATPCGVLKVTRFFEGWVAHRGGEQLSWGHRRAAVVFASLEDAKTAALLHVHDCFVDGTRWQS